MKTTTRFYLNEKQWSKIKNLLPPERGRCARPSKDNRLMVEGMIWKLRTGAPWRDLPRETFGPWESVYTRFSRWSGDGIFQKFFDFIKDDLENDVAILDSTTVRAHQHSHGAVKKKVNKK